MKTKFSFLAQPLCLGLALAFILIACTSGKTDEPDPSSTSGGGVSNVPPPLSSAVEIPEVKFDGFGVDATSQYEKVSLMGTANGSAAVPIVKVEFLGIQSSWISFSPTLPSPIVKLANAVIDLSNSAIPCGTHNIQVKACLDQGCSAGKFGTSEVKTFEKPAYMCAVSSSSITLSSSSKTPWKFGQPTVAEVSLGESVSIGTGSFKLSGDDTQPDIQVVGGKIRETVVPDSDDGIVPGNAYSSEESPRGLGSTPPTSSDLGDLGVQKGDFYLIYLNSGDKYLVRFTPAGGVSWANWPKTCTYWLATQSP